MQTIEEQVKNVNNKLQQLLKKHALLKKENEMLTAQLTVLKEQEQVYKGKIDSMSQKLNILQATAGNIDNESKRDFEKRINQYIKDIDKYINMLNG